LIATPFEEIAYVCPSFIAYREIGYNVVIIFIALGSCFSRDILEIFG